ncbi:MAG: DUF2993 domain-containing protein [Bacillota bacterium]
MVVIKRIIVILVIVLIASTEVLLPNYVGNRLENSLKAEVDSYHQLNLEVDSFPALKLLVAAADEVKVTGQDIVVEDLKLEQLKAEFRNLKLKEIAGEWETVRGENTELEIIITEKDINRYLITKEELAAFERIKLDITPQQVILNGIITLFSAEVNLQLTGNFTVVDAQKIVFNSEQLAVENFLVSTSSIQQLKEKLQFELDLTELPLPLEVKEVELAKDRLIIKGFEDENK